MSEPKYKWLAAYWDTDDPERCADIVDPKDNLSLGGYRCCHGKFDQHTACSGRHPFIAIIPESRYDYDPPPKVKPKPCDKSTAARPKPVTSRLSLSAIAKDYDDPWREYAPTVEHQWRIISPTKIMHVPSGEIITAPLTTPYACRHGSMPGEICLECQR
jgi:hypothetical protein